MLPVSRQHYYYSFMSRSTLYPAADGQQTGNNFVDGNKQHVAGNMLPDCPGVNAAFELSLYLLCSFTADGGKRMT